MGTAAECRGRIRPARRAGTTARQCRFFSTTVPPCAKKASFPGGAIHWKSCRPILDRMYGEFGGRVVPPPQTVGSRPPPAWGVWGVCTMCRWGVTLVVPHQDQGNPNQTQERAPGFPVSKLRENPYIHFVHQRISHAMNSAPVKKKCPGNCHQQAKANTFGVSRLWTRRKNLTWSATKCSSNSRVFSFARSTASKYQ